MGNGHSSENVLQQQQAFTPANTHLEILQHLPSGTAWSFQKCVLPQQSPKKGNTLGNSKKNKKGNSAKASKTDNDESSIATSGGEPDETSQIETHEVGGVKYYTWEIPENVKEYRKACDLLEKIGCKDISNVEKITAILNPTLVEPFVTQLAVFRIRKSENASLFFKQDWKRNDTEKIRQKIFDVYEKYKDSFAWNDTENIPLIPVITVGTWEEIQLIIKFGFDIGASANFGKIGHGIYVIISPTTKKETEGNDLSTKNNVILVSYAIPGNVYPISSEDLHKEKPLQGNPIKNGYNSHLALVHPTTCDIVDGNSNDNEGHGIDHQKIVGQLAIEQPAQLVPALIVHTRPTQ